MMSLQVISVLASSSAVFVVLSETTFFRGNTEEVSGVGYIQYDSGFLKFSLLHASHQGLSWGGEVNNWTERKSVGMDNELDYYLPSPTI